MSKDYVSLVNLWCQKEHKDRPTYEYSFHYGWICSASAEWLSVKVNSKTHASKREAKQDCANKLYHTCNGSLREKIECCEKTCILIDGDQRADCWKWLADEHVEWDPHHVAVKVYTGPTTPEIKCNRITCIRVDSPNKDSADAKILMDLGGMIATECYKCYVMVSSDHILAQTAQTTPCVISVANLAQLKAYLKIEN